MDTLPVCELIDEKTGASDEKQLVRNLMDRMAQIAKASQDKETAVCKILSEAYSSVGFGPMISALKACAV